MKHQDKYNKEISKWETYVNTRILPNVAGVELKTIPMAKMLVENKWIENVQRQAYRIAKIGGYEGSIGEYTLSLMKYKTYNGKTINAWKNSYERKMASKMVKGIKTRTSKEAHVLATMDDVFDAESATQMFSIIKKPTKAQSALLRTFVANPTPKKLKALKGAVRTHIETVVVPNAIKDTIEKVNIYQGKRLFKDQLQRQNNIKMHSDKVEMASDIKDKPELVLVGYWKLSPTHPWGHMIGDPCEEFASNDAGYGEGSWLGDDIPIPVEDSHFGCGCEVEFAVVEVKDRTD